MYDDRVPKEQVLSKLAEIAADESSQTDLWILGSTGPVAAQDLDTAEAFGRRLGIAVLVFDWAPSGLAALPTLLTLSPDVTAKFLAEKLGETANLVRVKLAAVSNHPQFADRAAQLKAALSEPSLAPAYARSANEAWLRAVFVSAKHARAVLGQPLAPGDVSSTKVLDRATIRDAFGRSLFGAPNGAIAALLGVDGSGKSWLFAQTWLAQPDKVLTLVLVPNDFGDQPSPENIENLLISKCVTQTGSAPGPAVQERWRRYFQRWRQLTNPARPTFVVFVDGINERSNLRWDRILDTLSDLLSGLAGKLAISCRSAFFHDRLEMRVLSAVEQTIVPEWSKDELERLLSTKGLTLAKLNPAVVDSLKNPRLFSIASQLLDAHRIQQIEELSVSRLLFEYIWSSDPRLHATREEFARHVRDHADIIVDRLRKQDTQDLTIFDSFAAGNQSGSTWSSQFDAVSAGRFFEKVEGEPTLYRLKEDSLPLALGLSLLSTMRHAHRNQVDLQEELSKILDPIAALDKTSDILLGAVMAAVLDRQLVDEIAAALIQAFVGLQNPDSTCYPEFRALARSRTTPFLLALELASLKERLTPNLSWLTEAIFEVKNEPACSTAVAHYLHRWLNFFSDSPRRNVVPYGLSAQQQAAEYAKSRAEIDRRLASLSAIERKILDELVHVEGGDYAGLSSTAFRLLAGTPLAPLAGSLRNWKFADVLNGAFSPDKEFRHLLTLNRVDWLDARAALLKELEELNGFDTSSSGRWARAGLLQATGDLNDAKEASVLIEELTKDRDSPRGWRLIETYCDTDPCNPASERPANIDTTAKKYPMIDFSKIHDAQGPGRDYHFFEGAMIGLARFEPEAALSGLRKLASNILTRDGAGFRQGVFFLENYTSALDDQTARKFAAKAATVSAEGLAVGDRHKQFWMAAQYALLIAFPHMSGNEQLETLVTFPKDDNITLELGETVRPCDPARFEAALQRAVDTDDVTVQFKLLMLARCTGIELSAASRALVECLVVSPARIVRICALGLILRLQDTDMLRSVVLSGWTASTLNVAEEGFEIWYGSRVLIGAAARGLLSDEHCLQRIALNAYPSFVEARGSEATALVAKRLDAAIERASAYRIEGNLPEIVERSEASDRPSGYYIKDRPNPQQTELETIKRFSEHAAAFYERQERNQAAFDAFLRDLTQAGAMLLTEFVTEGLISAIAAVNLPLIEKWHQAFMSMDIRTLSQMHNIATLVAEVMSRHDPVAGAALFERLIEAPAIIRITFGRTGLDLYTVSLWNAADDDAMRAFRFRRLDDAPNDNAIAVEVLAALRAGKQDVLRDYVADRVARPEPSYVARAVMVSAFSELADWAVHTVARFADARGFLGVAYDAAKYAMDRYNWSVHWTKLMADAKTDVELWRYAVILSKIADARFRLPTLNAREMETPLARYRNSVAGLIEARIKSWQDKRSKTLFGMDAPDSVYLN